MYLARRDKQTYLFVSYDPTVERLASLLCDLEVFCLVMGLPGTTQFLHTARTLASKNRLT